MYLNFSKNFCYKALKWRHFSLNDHDHHRSSQNSLQCMNSDNFRGRIAYYNLFDHWKLIVRTIGLNNYYPPVTQWIVNHRTNFKNRNLPPKRYFAHRLKIFQWILSFLEFLAWNFRIYLPFGFEDWYLIIIKKEY